MDSLVYQDANDVVTKMNTGDREKDLEMVNAVLSGSIQIRPQEEEAVEEKTEEISTEEPVEENTELQDSSVSTFEEEEAERQRLYYEMLEKRRQEEKENLLREKREKEEEAEREKRLREDLEKRIQEIEKRSQNDQNLSQQDVSDEDEEFVSEYTKKTRKMVEELKQDIGGNQEVYERIKKIEDALNSENEKREKFEQEKRRLEEEKKIFGNIRQFLSGHPELKPEKDVEELDKEYKRFRQDIAYISGSRSLEELERAIDDYKNGGKTRELADKNGIKDIPDLSKYDSIVELMDFKDGLKYDPVLGKHIPIVDEKGVQVRYRSLEEAYNIKNYYDNLTKERRHAYKDVSKKLEQFNDSPVTLRNDVTDTVNTSLSVEQEHEILNMNPREWINNPEKRKLVEMVYSKYGLEAPKYRGRKF